MSIPAKSRDSSRRRIRRLLGRALKLVLVLPPAGLALMPVMEWEARVGPHRLNGYRNPSSGLPQGLSYVEPTLFPVPTAQLFAPPRGETGKWVLRIGSWEWVLSQTFQE